MDVLLEISRLLNTGLDMESLSICVRLCEQGINPEALSAVIKELRKASETLKASENCTNWRCSLVSSVWTLTGSCPVPGSVPMTGSPASRTCLCVGTLSSASPRRRTAPVLCFDLCLEFLCGAVNLSPLPKHESSPDTRPCSAILPQICKILIQPFVASISYLNLRAYF